MLQIDGLDQYTSPKVISLEELSHLVGDLKTKGKKIGLCSGGFDLLHPGHMKHFELAKNYCDILVVSITDNEQVKSRKGNGRPVYPAKLRAYAAAAIWWVDYVVVNTQNSSIELIKRIKPSFYIKGPDYVNKMTPGIISERNAIKDLGGNIKYTLEKPLSTTKIIRFIKQEVSNDSVLVILDRDGTLINEVNFLGKNDNWRDELVLNNFVIAYLSALNTRYNSKQIVITNQAGVARNYFDCKRVEDINQAINYLLEKQGIYIHSWVYCPDVDTKYATNNKDLIDFNQAFVRDKTERKPNPSLIYRSLKQLNLELTSFDKILVLGDRLEDQELAINLKAQFIDVKSKNYDDLIKEFF